MNKAKEAAALLAASHASGRPFVAGGDLAPANVEAAYAVQDIVLEALEPGRRPAVWKVSPPRGDAAPVASPILGGRVFASGVSLPSAGLRLFGIECEIAYRFGRDLDARDSGYEAAAIAEAVAEAVVAIELCESRLANWQEASALWRLADFQLNGALIVGGGIAAWRALDWRVQQVELWIDGAPRVKLCGSHPCGDPAELLSALAAHCARRCGGLRAGDLVTTGSWTGMTIAGPEADVRAVFPGIGEARLRLQS